MITVALVVDRIAQRFHHADNGVIGCSSRANTSVYIEDARIPVAVIAFEKATK